METVKYVRPSREKGRILLCLAGEDKGYSIAQTLYLSLGEPLAGAELDSEAVALVKEGDEDYRAMKKALSMLSFSDKSGMMLYSRLVSSGFSRRAARLTVEECKRLGYVDEKRQLLRIVKEEANRALKGPYLIKRKLMSKGFKGEDIDFAISKLIDEGEIDFADSFRRLAQKKGAEGYEELMALRYKNGYAGEF